MHSGTLPVAVGNLKPTRAKCQNGEIRARFLRFLWSGPKVAVKGRGWPGRGRAARAAAAGRRRGGAVAAGQAGGEICSGMATHVAVRGRRKGSGDCGGAVAAKLASEVTLHLALSLAPPI